MFILRCKNIKVQCIINHSKKIERISHYPCGKMHIAYTMSWFTKLSQMFYTQNLWCVATAALLYTYNSHHNPNPYQSIFIFKRCKFQVGSYSYDDTKMIFLESGRVKGYVETSRSIVLDYDVKINPLSPKVTNIW